MKTRYLTGEPITVKTRQFAALAAAVLLLSSTLPAAEQQQSTDLPPKTVRQKVLEKNVESLLKPYVIENGIKTMTPLPTGEGNAAEHYAKLEVLYTKEKEEDSIAVKPDSRGVQAILAGAQIRKCSLTPNFYPHMETGTSKQPDMVVFQAYRHALMEYAKAVAATGKNQQAEQIYQAGLIWGWHLTQDRPNLVTLSLGYSIQMKCAEEYEHFLRKNLWTEKANRAEDFIEKCRQMRRAIWAKARVYLGDFRNFACLYSAAQIALNDKDALWRQEAVLRLGVLRHGAPDPRQGVIFKSEALQGYAEKTLMEVAAKDPAPWVRKLAIWTVEHITPERFDELKRNLLFDTLNEANSNTHGDDESSENNN